MCVCCYFKFNVQMKIFLTSSDVFRSFLLKCYSVVSEVTDGIYLVHHSEFHSMNVAHYDIVFDFFIAAKTPANCSANCYRAIATTILSCFVSVENMASLFLSLFCLYIQFIFLKVKTLVFYFSIFSAIMLLTFSIFACSLVSIINASFFPLYLLF